jgi:hypothetical protein
MDPFEAHLAAIPHRAPAPELRARVLEAAAREERRNFPALAAPVSASLRLLLSLAKSVFAFPHPLAWGAVATCWLVIAALNFSGPRGEALYAVTPPGYRDRLPSAQEYLVEWETERRLIALLETEPIFVPTTRATPFPLRPEDL